MSKPAQMSDCPQCSHSDLTEPIGKVRRYIQGTNRYYIDTCDKCGGSGRIPIVNIKMFDRKTIMLKKQQKATMKEWIAKEKELVWGIKE